MSTAVVPHSQVAHRAVRLCSDYLGLGPASPMTIFVLLYSSCFYRKLVVLSPSLYRILHIPYNSSSPPNSYLLLLRYASNSYTQSARKIEGKTNERSRKEKEKKKKRMCSGYLHPPNEK